MPREPSTPPGQDRKQQILEVSEKLFAEKGFAATGIDEIARTAGIAKSLIYYYFKGKDDILRALFDRFIDKTIPLKLEQMDVFLEDPHGNFGQLMDVALAFIREHRDIIRVLFMEALKGEADVDLLAFVDRNFTAGFEGLESRGAGTYPDEKRARLNLAAFYFGFLPLITFDLFDERWREHYGVDASTARRQFVEFYQRMYFSLMASEVL
jgi:AcrR family transcriptional regulator